MIFQKGAALFATELGREQGEDVLYVNMLGAAFVPSIADDSSVMSRTLSLLTDNSSVSRIVFVQQRNYTYPPDQVFLLAEIARVYNFLMKQDDILSPQRLGLLGNPSAAYEDLRSLLDSLFRDPLGCYLELRRRIQDMRAQLEQGVGNRSALVNYVRLLERVFHLLEGTSLVKQNIGSLSESRIRRREIYKEIFRPAVLPNFTFTRLASQLPSDAALIDQYEILSDFESIPVTILKRRNDSKYFYHIMPSEYGLSEEHHLLLNLARGVLSEHRPKVEEYSDPMRTRQVFFNISRDMLSELAQRQGIRLTHRELDRLARILVRHTIGFGLIEVLLLDNRLQDIVLNAPITLNPIFVRHERYDECVTNIVPSFEDANSWAGKLRLQSGRPLDEANPVLDSDLVLEHARARVAAINEPLSPSGLAFAFRRHRDEPWTLPLYIHNRMLNSFAAGLLSFMIDGSRTLLVAGTRSAGKTSLLGSLLLEILPKYRVLVVEDTLELPVDSLRKIGYDILRMKVRSALISGTTEVEASEGIRASLRLGDSALIVGEVRSAEARALYEAMRVGALANVVAGTIHGDSPYSVFDRVVNDLGVPVTSFKASDLIIVANPIKTPDGLHSLKRVVQIAEVRKHWTRDPLEERGFVDLLRYNVEKDELEPTPELINGDSEVIKSIAGSVKGWAGNWDAVYDNIILRGQVKQEIVSAALRLRKPILMEAAFNAVANGAFHRISDEVRQEIGIPWSEKVFPRWKEWLDKTAEGF